MAEPLPVLEMTGIVKEFPGVRALSGVDFRLFPGEIHALLGENGAGKSTLIKVLTGVYSLDGGTVTLNGTSVRFHSPSQAQQAGISTVYQEVNLCPNLSVAENIFIGREPTRFGRIQWKRLRREAAELVDRLTGQLDHAVVDLVHAGEDLDQGRLAGAVLAHQGVHFAAEQPEVHALQRDHAREPLADPAHRQDRPGLHHRCHTFPEWEPGRGPDRGPGGG